MWGQNDETISIVSELLEQNQKLSDIPIDQRPKDARFYKIAIYLDEKPESDKEFNFKFQNDDDWYSVENVKNQFWNKYCLISKIQSENNSLENQIKKEWKAKEEIFPSQIFFCFDNYEVLKEFNLNNSRKDSNAEIVENIFSNDNGFEKIYLLRSLKYISQNEKINVFDFKSVESNKSIQENESKLTVVEPAGDPNAVISEPVKLDSYQELKNEYINKYNLKSNVKISENTPNVIEEIFKNASWTKKWISKVVKQNKDCKIVKFPNYQCFELSFQKYDSPKSILDWLNCFVVGFYYSDFLLEKNISTWPSIYFIHAISENEMLVTEWISSSNQIMTFKIENYSNLYFFPATLSSFPFKITLEIPNLESNSSDIKLNDKVDWKQYLELLKQKLCVDTEFNNLIWKSNSLEYLKFIYSYYVQGLRQIYESKWGKLVLDFVLQANEKLIFNPDGFFFKSISEFDKNYKEMKLKYPDYNNYLKENEKLNFEIQFIKRIDSFLFGTNLNKLIKVDSNPSYSEWKQFFDQYLLPKCEISNSIPNRYIIFRTWCVINNCGPFKHEINLYEEKIKNVEKLLSSINFNISNPLLCN